MSSQRVPSRILRPHSPTIANAFWDSAQSAMERFRHRSYGEAFDGARECTTGLFVRAGAFLEDGNCPSYFSESFEVTKQDDGIREIRHIHRRFHVPNHSMLGDGEKCRSTHTVQILQQLVHVQR